MVAPVIAGIREASGGRRPTDRPGSLRRQLSRIVSEPGTSRWSERAAHILSRLGKGADPRRLAVVGDAQAIIRRIEEYKEARRIQVRPACHRSRR